MNEKQSQHFPARGGEAFLSERHQMQADTGEARRPNVGVLPGLPGNPQPVGAFDRRSALAALPEAMRRIAQANDWSLMDQLRAVMVREVRPPIPPGMQALMPSDRSFSSEAEMVIFDPSDVEQCLSQLMLHARPDITCSIDERGKYSSKALTGMGLAMMFALQMATINLGVK